MAERKTYTDYLGQKSYNKGYLLDSHGELNISSPGVRWFKALPIESYINNQKNFYFKLFKKMRITAFAVMGLISVIRLISVGNLDLFLINFNPAIALFCIGIYFLEEIYIYVLYYQNSDIRGSWNLKNYPILVLMSKCFWFICIFVLLPNSMLLQLVVFLMLTFLPTIIGAVIAKSKK